MVKPCMQHVHATSVYMYTIIMCIHYMCVRYMFADYMCVHYMCIHYMCVCYMCVHYISNKPSYRIQFIIGGVIAMNSNATCVHAACAHVVLGAVVF